MSLLNLKATIYSGPPENTKISFRAFLSILIGLVAIFAVVYFLHLEENLNLIKLLVVVVVGFVLYAFLPIAYRLPLLFALNLVAIFVMLGLMEGVVLIAIALVLFTILNLPISVRARTLLLVAAGVFFAIVRLNWLSLPFSNIVLPVIAGLFMFRSILFLYEQRFAKKEVSLWLRLNYFFLLPNLVFVIFPVVDYKTFINNYYSKPAFETYRKGILWMANGVLHFFAYRLIYYYLVPNPTEIQDVYGSLQYMIATYALIVRLAGIFHFSAGVICLFGFEIPPTFNHYFFADSFSDLWRRINIYWRAFVMKVFYYPIYFKLKHIGTVKAIALSILITFAINWFLHAYQWFWIRGSFLFSIQDISFWAVFGIAVMLNSIYLAMPRRKTKGQKDSRFLNAVFLSLRVIGIFMFMAFLWSWWTTPSITDWLGLINVWKNISSADVLFLASRFIGLVFIGVVIQYVRSVFHQQPEEKRLSTSTNYKLSVAGILMLASIGLPAVSSKLEKHFDFDMDPVLTTQLNDADRETQFKGYYETMLEGKNILETPLDKIQEGRPADWLQLHTLGAIIHSKDLITKWLKPNSDYIFKGARFQTNDLGLRDRPVQLERPPNTLRIALLGGSIEMGTGVTTEQTYENILEDQLTKEKIFKPFGRVEIVNFAISGIHMPQHLARVDKIIPDYHPQVVVYTAHSDEIRRIMSTLYRVYVDTLVVEYDYLNKVFADLNLPRSIDEGTFRRALRPKMLDLINWGLTHIKQKVEAIGAIPVWVFVPSLDGKYTPEEDEKLYQQAIELGFFVLDLRNFNDDVPEQDIILGNWDRHPNAQGHELLAKKMYQEIVKNKELIKRISDTYQAN